MIGGFPRGPNSARPRSGNDGGIMVGVSLQDLALRFDDAISAFGSDCRWDGAAQQMLRRQTS